MCPACSLQLSNGWEKRLNNAVKMMLKKKQLAHAAGHMGSFRLSKSMAAKEEKRMHRKPREAKVSCLPSACIGRPARTLS